MNLLVTILFGSGIILMIFGIVGFILSYIHKMKREELITIICFVTGLALFIIGNLIIK